MTSITTSLPARLAVRVAISATLAVSGLIHAYLYVHGYNHIPTIGPAFLLQASGFCALAVLILVGGLFHNGRLGGQPRPVPPYRCKHSRSWPLDSGEELP